jgi:flagellin-like protein
MVLDGQGMRKGIAPLVATLLLISFAVSIGVVFMSFGRAQIGLESTCTIDIGLKFLEIGGQKQICINTLKNDLTFTIENGVNIAVDGVLVNVIGSERAESYDLNDAKMTKAGSYVTHLGYNEELSGDIRQMKIIPKVVLFDTQEVCVEKALVVENIPEC